MGHSAVATVIGGLPMSSTESPMPAGKLLLVALALEIQALMGWSLPAAELPGLTLVEEEDVVIASGTGGHSAGRVRDAVYVPEWNVIFVEQKAIADPQEFQAILVHELVHWWQAKRIAPSTKRRTEWEVEARQVENRWREKNGVKRR